MSVQERSAIGRAAFDARMERLADPLGLLTPEERAEATRELRKAYFRTIGRRGGLAKAEYDRRERGEPSVS
jgi:hypothetical protein